MHFTFLKKITPYMYMEDFNFKWGELLQRYMYMTCIITNSNETFLI